MSKEKSSNSGSSASVGLVDSQGQEHNPTAKEVKDKADEIVQAIDDKVLPAIADVFADHKRQHSKSPTTSPPSPASKRR